MPLDFSNIPKAPDDLIDALKNNRAIAIVGSGLSIAAGGPTWKELLLGIAADAFDTKPNEIPRIKNAIDAITRDRFLDTASILKDILGPGFTSSIIKQIGKRRKPICDQEAIQQVIDTDKVLSIFRELSTPQPRNCWPTKSHRILMQLGFRAIITTNYDRLLELASPSKQIFVCSNSFDGLSDLLRSNNSFIFKLHGDIQHSRDFIVTREDYARIRNTDIIQNFLKNLFESHHLFWIGYGHNDPHLDLLIDELLIKYNISSGTALIVEGEKIMLDRLGNARIFSSTVKSYENIPDYLNRLAKDTGHQLVSTLIFEIPWTNQHEIDSIGHAIAKKLSLEIGSVIQYLGGNPGSVKLYFSLSFDTLENLRRFFDEKNQALLNILYENKVIALDSIDIDIERVEPERVQPQINFVNRFDEIREPIRIFISYSHTDEELKNKLLTHLASLRREGSIQDWHFRKILPGAKWDKEIDRELERAQIILLLISADFIASDYCFGVELKRALERHNDGEARVISVILRPANWRSSSLGKLQALPTDAKPIKKWSDEDEAFLDVITGIRRVVEEMIVVEKVAGEGITMKQKEIKQIEFVNRFDEIRDITKTFYAPYLLISAPKEYGKTRLLQQVKLQLENEYFCIYLELSRQKSYSVETIASQILNSLPNQQLNHIKTTTPYKLGGQIGRSILQKLHLTSKRRVLIIIDEAETISNDVANSLLNEFIPAIEEVLRAAQEIIPLRIILSGRYISNWKQISSRIPLTPLILTPFDFDTIHQTVIKFNSQQEIDMGSDYLRKFASNLMYFTGGHPGCMANILRSNDFGLPIPIINSMEDVYYNEIVEPVIEAIGKDIPDHLRKVFENLSAVRYFNSSLLKWLINKKLIKWTKPVYELEDQLLQTYLIDNDEGFLNDEITRRLFAIRLRRTQKEHFIEVCKETIHFYKKKLEQGNVFGSHIIAIEILFQRLQLLIEEPNGIKIFIESLTELLNLLSSFADSKVIISAVEKRLSQDWEFQFYFNYIFPEYLFKNIINEITTFKQAL